MDRLPIVEKNVPFVCGDGRNILIYSLVRVVFLCILTDQMKKNNKKSHFGQKKKRELHSSQDLDNIKKETTYQLLRNETQDVFAWVTIPWRRYTKEKDTLFNSV